MGDPAPAAGHNSELTEAETKALFFDHYNKIAAQLETVKAAQAEYKKLRKTCKADGIVLADMDFALRCAEVDDAKIIPDELRRRTQIATWFNLPLLFQPDLFEDRAPADERIESDGYTAGMKGKDAKSGYGSGSHEDKLWLAGWERGQAEMRESLKSGMEKLNAKRAAKAEPDQSKPADKTKDPFPDKPGNVVEMKGKQSVPEPA